MKKIDISILWEAVKTPLRQGLLFVYAFIINSALDFIATSIGFNFTEEQKIQIMGFGTPLVWSILSFVDKYLHDATKEQPKVEQNTGLLGVKGLTGF